MTFGLALGITVGVAAWLGLFYVAFRNRRLVDYGINIAINQHARLMSRELAREGTSGTVRDDLVASVTTTFDRLHSVGLAMESILLQTVRPARVVLYLSDQVSQKDLPASVTGLFRHGVEVRFIDDVGPHSKLIYALRDFPAHRILTFDDDFYYPPQTVEGMLSVTAIAPQAIVGNWVRRLRFGPTGRVLRARWGALVTPKTMATEIEPPARPLAIGHDLFAYGTGGVLYPPGCMDERVFDVAAFKRLCPTEDDVWFKGMSLLKGTPVAAAPLGHTPRHHVIQGSQRVALRHKNYSGVAGATQNQIRAVFAAYDLYALLRLLRDANSAESIPVTNRSPSH